MSHQADLDTPRVYGFSEDAVIPDAVSPMQFLDIWGGARRAPVPERALMVAVLTAAIDDYQRGVHSRSVRRLRRSRTAVQWIGSGSRDWPFSYVNLCEMIGVDPEKFRDAIFRGADAARTALRTRMEYRGRTLAA